MVTTAVVPELVTHVLVVTGVINPEEDTLAIGVAVLGMSGKRTAGSPTKRRAPPVNGLDPVFVV